MTLISLICVLRFFSDLSTFPLIYQTYYCQNYFKFEKVIRPGKKNFGSGQLIFENWSGGPVDVFFFGTTT